MLLQPSLAGESFPPIDFTPPAKDDKLFQRYRVEKGFDYLALGRAGIDFVAVALDANLEDFSAFKPGFLAQLGYRLPVFARAGTAHDIAIRHCRLGNGKRTEQRGGAKHLLDRMDCRHQVNLSIPGIFLRLFTTVLTLHASSSGARWTIAGTAPWPSSHQWTIASR